MPGDMVSLPVEVLEAWNHSPLLPLSLCNFCSSAPQPLISVWNLTETISALPALAWELEHCAPKLLKGKISLFTSQRQCFGAERWFLVPLYWFLLCPLCYRNLLVVLTFSGHSCFACFPPSSFSDPCIWWWSPCLAGNYWCISFQPRWGFTRFRASACKFMLLIRHKERN